MNRTDCIELVQQLTERKGEKLIDMNLLFNTTLQRICRRARFWWRKLDITFSLTQNTTTYDFTAITTSPSISEIAVEEVVTIALILQPPTTNTLINAPELTPIFDPAGIRAMKQNTSQAQPSRYIMGIDGWNILRIDPPDQTYTAEMTFWAMPMIDKDTSSNVIPLIPPFYHSVIVSGMEAAINKRVYGPKDTRYVGAAADFEAQMQDLHMRKQFTTNVNQQWRTTENSVQSTAPNNVISPPSP